MLINFTNHPSNSWGKDQLTAATFQYNEIMDIPFPMIQPDLELTELREIVKEYLNQIVDLRPDAVHISGEPVFTYIMVNELRIKGIQCIASTTSRNVVYSNNGIKKTQFKFNSFRSYF